MTTPAATLPGIAQEQWIVDRMGASKSTWNRLAQQVLMASHDLVPSAEKGYSTDQWDAYRASRQRVLAAVRMKRPAASLVPRRHDLRAVLRQHARSGVVLRTERHLLDASGEQSDSRSLGAHGRRDFRHRRPLSRRR